MPFGFKWPQRIPSADRSFVVSPESLHKSNGLLPGGTGVHSSELILPPWNELQLVRSTRAAPGAFRHGQLAMTCYGRSRSELMPSMGQPPPTAPTHLMDCYQGTAIYAAELVLSPWNQAERVRSKMVAPETFWPCQVALTSYSCSRSDLCPRWNNLSRQFPRSLFV